MPATYQVHLPVIESPRQSFAYDALERAEMGWSTPAEERSLNKKGREKDIEKALTVLLIENNALREDNDIITCSKSYDSIEFPEEEQQQEEKKEQQQQQLPVDPSHQTLEYRLKAARKANKALKSEN